MAIILVVVVVRRKATYKQKEEANTPLYISSMMAKQNNEMEENGLGAAHVAMNM